MALGFLLHGLCPTLHHHHPPADPGLLQEGRWLWSDLVRKALEDDLGQEHTPAPYAGKPRAYMETLKAFEEQDSASLGLQVSG